ncbi:methyl-accepting chemotaxis protein [Thalassobacillus cyri]|uniref:Methyl-accepting chemotaxis protein n=1 Tax=Thalassobacillus cyri TaxID=571932 RepID=A0A1H4AQM4_9BACI|nr:methyl-accepting chemotaxis protein [Thalassobacillus cyri]SEA38196.1 methyl-accepting chemotaxis protein [Thalassobacillus cyri]
MKIKYKLLILILLPLLVTGLIIGAIIFQMAQINADNSGDVENLIRVEKLNGSISSLQNVLNNYSVTPSAAYQEQIERSLIITEQHIAELEKSLPTGQQQEQLDKAKQKFQTLAASTEEVLAEQDTNAAKMLSIRTKGIVNDLYLLTIYAEERYEEGQQNLTDKINSIQWFSAIALFTLLSISGTAAVLFTRKMVGTIRSLSNKATLVASGDLNVESTVIDTKDELGTLNHSFNVMIENLQQLISTIGSTSEQVAASAEELSASADETSRGTEQITGAMQEVSAGTEQQNQMVEDSSTTVGEMAKGVKHIIASADVVSNLAHTSQRMAMDGQKSVQETVNQMEAITSSVEETDQSVRSLEKSSKEINNITRIITEVADQTNLLALNAAIEAARAGESGKGFAVVADEVRKLAEQTANAAGQIQNLINDIQTDTEHSVGSMDAVKERVQNGRKVTLQTADHFEAILTGMNDVAEEIKAITSISDKINESTDKVTKAVHETAEVARQNSDSAHSVASASEQQLASMEEINASAASLTNLAEELQELVQNFRTA